MKDDERATASAATPDGPSSGVPALERGFQILGFLSRSGPAPLATIVDATDLNKSTVFYALRTLVELDAVRYDASNKTYSLGPALIELGAAAGAQFDLVSLARRELTALVAELQTTVVLYRRFGLRDVVILDRLEQAHGIRITVETGSRLPIQGASFGRAFLAFDPPDVLTNVLSSGLVRFTSKSTTSVSAFKRDLDLVRQRGWAVDHEGFALGVSTVAAPIFGADGTVALVAAAVGFTSLTTDASTLRYGSLLRTACDRIGLPFSARNATQH